MCTCVFLSLCVSLVGGFLVCVHACMCVSMLQCHGVLEAGACMYI